jgi:putative methyltransferase (TIGR04325 family)
MRGLILDGAKIFDLGGNIGHLFYLYDRYLDLPQDCIWLVFDLPAPVESGKIRATNRGENRLRFTRKWEDATGAELLIASGSLHYFDTPLSQMVSELSGKTVTYPYKPHTSDRRTDQGDRSGRWDAQGRMRPL